ncbi:MAG: hypothetical protein ACK53W_12710 [Gemmatimonadota bacterium]
MPTLLTDLVLDEVSLVDVPANPGARMLIYKRAAGEAADPRTQESQMADKFSVCPDCTTKAACVGKGMCMKAGKESDMSKTDTGDMSPAELAAALDAAHASVDTLKADLAKRDAEIATLKAAAGKEADVDKKADPAVPAEVQKRLDDMQKAVDDANAIVKAEREERAKIAAIAKAERDYPNLPGDPIEKGGALAALSALPEAARTTIEKMLVAGNKAIGDAMVEKGSGGGADAGTAEAKLNDLARKRAGEKGEPFAKAYQAVLDENPKLYGEYVAEKRIKSRAA